MADDFPPSLLEQRLASGERKLAHALQRQGVQQVLPLRYRHLRQLLEGARVPRAGTEDALVVTAVGQLEDRRGGQQARANPALMSAIRGRSFLDVLVLRRLVTEKEAPEPAHFVAKWTLGARTSRIPIRAAQERAQENDVLQNRAAGAWASRPGARPPARASTPRHRADRTHRVQTRPARSPSASGPSRQRQRRVQALHVPHSVPGNRPLAVRWFIDGRCSPSPIGPLLATYAVRLPHAGHT